MVFAIHWHESAMNLHVFPIPIPPPACLSIPSLWVFPVHQPWALVSCIQPGLVICFTLDSIFVSMLFSQNIPPSPGEAILFSRGSSQPRDQTQVSHIAGRFFTSWVFREAQERWSGYPIPSPADLPDPGIKLESPALQVDSLPDKLP